MNIMQIQLYVYAFLSFSFILSLKNSAGSRILLIIYSTKSICKLKNSPKKLLTVAKSNLNFEASFYILHKKKRKK